MQVQDLNVVMDIILIVASIWMIFSVRGLGGIVGKTLNLIVIGTIILGVAHLQATLTAGIFGGANSFVHRVFVLIGFIFLVIGFRQITEMKRD